MGFMEIITETSPKRLTIEKNKDYLLIVVTYSKTPKLYGMEQITTEKVIDKLDMF